jgi:CheY-like chemotaxis protein
MKAEEFREAELTAVDSKTASVLLIEDDPALGMVTVEVLHELGYNVSWSVSSSDAQALFEAGRRFDAMILDLRLGQEHGVDLVDAIHADGYQVPPIIIFSAEPFDALAQAAHATAAVGILQKPCTATALENRLQKALHACDRHA